MSEMAPEAPAVVDSAPETGEIAAEPAWSGVSQEQWEETQQHIASLSQYIQQRYQQEQAAQGQQRLAFDPFADNADEILRQVIREEVGPLQQTYQRIEQAEGEELVLDVIADNVSREGDFIFPGSKEDAARLAPQLVHKHAQKFGYTDKAAELAIEEACALIRERDVAIGKAYYEREQNKLATLAGVKGEPGAAGAASQVTNGQYQIGGSITDRYFT